MKPRHHTSVYCSILTTCSRRFLQVAFEKHGVGAIVNKVLRPSFGLTCIVDRSIMNKFEQIDNTRVFFNLFVCFM